MRDVVTNETGGYNVPNLLPGTYQVDVKLPGFSTFTARDIAVRQGLDVRVDAKLKRRRARRVDHRLGAGGRSADRERRCAVADDRDAARDRADQRPRLPDRPRPDARRRVSPTTISPAAATTRPARWRSRSTASRRTTRSSASTACRRSTSSSSRSRPTVPVSRRSKRSASSPAASTPIKGWRAAQSVNVQVKSGTNTLAGSLFEHATDYRMKSKNFFLPAGDPKGTRQRAHLRRNGRRADHAQQVLLLRQRRAHAPAHGRPATRCRTRAPTVFAACRRWRCARGISPARAPCSTIRGPECERHRASPVRVSELSGPHRALRRSAVRGVQLHSGEPHQPDREELPEQAGGADAAGIHEQLLRDEQLRHRLQQVRREDHLDAERARHHQRTARIRRQLRGQRAGDAVGRRRSSTRFSRDASGIRPFTATRWRSPPRCRPRW